MSKSLTFLELEAMLRKYKEIGNEEVTLKIDAVLDLIDLLKQNDLKVQILLGQKYNLVTELKKKGVSDEKIKKILDDTIRRA